MKKIIIYILLVLWMILIFFFSHQPDIESDKMSNGVIEKIINIVEIISNQISAFYFVFCTWNFYVFIFKK